MNPGMYSSNTGEWETPWNLFNQLDREFHFTLDVCATPSNTKCKRFYSPEDNALIQPWTGTVFCNPPYGRSISNWIKKGYEESQKGSTVVMLLPARTDTAWWHDYVMKAHEIRLIRGRIKFLPLDCPAPFPSCIVVFDCDYCLPSGILRVRDGFCCSYKIS